MTTQADDTESEATKKEKREERIQKLKAELKTKLTTAQETRIKNRCKAAQGLVTAAKKRVNTAETRRDKVHTGIVDRLTALVEKFKAANIDTTELEAQIATLKEKIAAFNTSIDAYNAVLDDLAVLDCVADPTGFKAALESARTMRAALVEDAKEIRAYITETIKPTLVALKQQLASTTESEE